jgi:hypothetical protein
MEFEIENSNYQNKLLDFHKCLTEINNTLGSINLEWTKLMQALE